MKNIYKISAVFFVGLSIIVSSCKTEDSKDTVKEASEFNHFVEQFARRVAFQLSILHEIHDSGNGRERESSVGQERHGSVHFQPMIHLGLPLRPGVAHF